MKAQLISNGWWQADLGVLSAPAFLLKKRLHLGRSSLTTQDYTVLLWPIYFVILDKECFDSYADVAFLLALRSIGFCSRVGYFCGSRTGKIEINSLSSLLSRCEIVFYMTKIGLIEKAAINSNKLFMSMRLSREKKPGSCTPFMQLTSRRPGNYIIVTNRMFQSLALLY